MYAPLLNRKRRIQKGGTRMEQLSNIVSVFAGRNHVGELYKNNEGEICFRYTDTWLIHEDAAPIAEHFPLQAEEFIGRDVESYFDNLLPEGGLRDLVSRASHISKNNVLGLLEYIGGDTAGTLSFLPYGKEPDGAQRYTQISFGAIRDWFNPMLPLPGGMKKIRWSLSGMQPKLPIAIDDEGNFLLPLGDSPSTHIIKPALRNPETPESAINETTIMLLAKEVGMDVPSVWFSPEINATVVERYDRVRDDQGRVIKLQQNDFCQILKVRHSAKYEYEGGPRIYQCFDAVRNFSCNPEADTRRLLEWVIFNLAVGNMDCHAKNISMLTTQEGTRLAPFYDLMCTRVYPRVDTDFPFRIGREFAPSELAPKNWMGFASEIGIPTRHIMDVRLDVCHRVAQSMPSVCNQIRQQLQEHGNLDSALSILDAVEQTVLTSAQDMLLRAEQELLGNRKSRSNDYSPSMRPGGR